MLILVTRKKPDSAKLDEKSYQTTNFVEIHVHFHRKKKG